ncbi:heat shock 70 kDa protein 12B-like [Dreissena polymorpha]|uniref:B box-type domain-containing protein n=1 Tax=Dreissena polymorpha TaxID=45954 RepID=A0A9D4LGJ2_DREPO|nr:heat shock 70 kDa protein 12B-like [Dreissena polymorpha]KAH3858185.1 hypothetical protein DPMN_100805 [Dreissena polymorpha]
MSDTTEVTEVSIDAVQNASDDVDIYCEPCYTDRKSTVAKGFCVQCEEYICDTCIKHHRKFSMSRLHTVLDQSQMPTNYKKQEPQAAECIEPCIKHRKEIIKFFCKPHKVLGCSVCIMLEHRTCDVEYIPEVSINFRYANEYIATKKELTDLIRNVEAKVQKSCSKLDYVHEMLTLEIEEIKSFRLEVILFLETKERELLDNIHSLRQKNMNIINKVKSEAEQIGERLLEMNGSLDDEDANDVQLYMAAKDIKSQFDDLRNLVANVGSTASFSEFCFKKDAATASILQSTVAFGRIEANDLSIWHQSHPKECLLTASINLGTTYTGMVYMLPATSFVGTLVFHQKGLVENVPASLLLQPDEQTVEAFGFNAEDKYSKLSEENKCKWYYFKRFWMQINENKCLSLDTMIRDEREKGLKASAVISSLLKNVLEEFFISPAISKAGLTPTDMHLILTVPGTWNNDAKTLMKRAVRLTGVNLGNLSVVSETDAASVFCLRGDIFQEDIPKPNTRYILCDLKDERLDLTLHEVDNKRKIKHLVTEHDCSLGLSIVNDAIEKFINSLAGCDVMTCLRMEHSEDYRSLMEDFVETLRHVNLASSKLSIRISESLLRTVEKMTSRSFQDQIQLSLINKGVKLLSCYKLRIDKLVYDSLFDAFIKGTAARIRTFITKHDHRINQILVVSQFVIPEPLQEGVRTALSDLKVVIPTEHSHAVLHGATMWGQQAL